MRTRAGQSGLTILGFIFVAAVVLSIAMIGFRVLPAYIEYFSVQKILKQAIDATPEGAGVAQLRHEFERRSGADYIESVHAPDVDLVKEGNKLIASAAWTKVLPLVGNVSLLLDFQAEASK